MKLVTPNNINNIEANEKKNETNTISWQDQSCLFAVIFFGVTFVF